MLDVVTLAQTKKMIETAKDELRAEMVSLVNEAIDELVDAFADVPEGEDEPLDPEAPDTVVEVDDEPKDVLPGGGLLPEEPEVSGN